jgi:hypothetical protein
MSIMADFKKNPKPSISNYSIVSTLMKVIRGKLIHFIFCKMVLVLNIKLFTRDKVHNNCFCRVGIHRASFADTPTNPGQTNPGQTNPGQTNPGHDKPWTLQTLDTTNPGQDKPWTE